MHLKPLGSCDRHDDQEQTVDGPWEASGSSSHRPELAASLPRAMEQVRPPPSPGPCLHPGPAAGRRGGRGSAPGPRGDARPPHTPEAPEPPQTSEQRRGPLYWAPPGGWPRPQTRPEPAEGAGSAPGREGGAGRGAWGPQHLRSGLWVGVDSASPPPPAHPGPPEGGRCSPEPPASGSEALQGPPLAAPRAPTGSSGHP